MVSGPRVLVVDDEPLVTRSCQRILGGEGYEVETIESGREGMERAFAQAFDLVLADLRMPDFDGMELVRALRRQRPGTAIVIITGYGTVSSAVEAVKLGVADYIEKPFEPDQILKAAKRALAIPPERPKARIEAQLVREVLKPAPQKNMVVVRTDKCLACKSCELACAVEHSRSKNLYEAIREKPAPRSRVKVAQGQGFTAPLQCRQCDDAPCLAICPTKALSRPHENSPIVVDQALCIGCKSCIVACPFGVIRLDSAGLGIIKCDQCFERVQDDEPPACVAACPTHALQFKEVEEVLAEKRDGYLLQIRRSMNGAEK